MCGIAGIFSLNRQNLPLFDPHRVLDSIYHRGPDDEGIFQAPGVFLGVRRLAIIDPAMGHQPVSDESGRYHLVMNGEIFDYDLFLDKLRQRGHRFHSHCDTEVAVHLVEEGWTKILDDIDGQYAMAAYDQREHRLFLARDRMGICPLFYAQVGDLLLFGSEMKALFATGLIRPVINRRSLDAVAAFGCVPAPGAVFEGVQQLMPGQYLEVHNGVLTRHTYWDIPYNDAGDYPDRPVETWADEFRDILRAACVRRLKADVPVGLYLSGGIDSATIAAMTADVARSGHEAFSISFPEPSFDESAKTTLVADSLGIPTRFLKYHQSDLAGDLPTLIYHGESPLVSTEAVPLMALSRLAHKHVKVVLTGEGADEALGGYLYFRWEAIKHMVGPGLLGWVADRVGSPFFRHYVGNRNSFVPQPADRRWAMDVFGCYPAIMMKFLYFRMIRHMVYSPEMLDRQSKCHDEEFLQLPRERMRRWDQYNRTLYLSSRIFMTNHLLGSHGDRALMANSVEGRYPFLDRTVQDFLAAVPPVHKSRWHEEKFLLRRAMEKRLPEQIIRTMKKPFLAPFGTQFVGKDSTEQIRDLLTPRAIKEFGYFDPAKVAGIVRFLEDSKASVAADTGESIRPGRQAVHQVVMGLAMTYVVSTQVLADQVRSGKFQSNAPAPAPATV